MRRFQFLGRNSGRSDLLIPSRVSSVNSGFNSSVGILVVRTNKLLPHAPPESLFQFLGRNSGRSDVSASGNYSPEFWAFQFLGRNSGRSDGKRGAFIFVPALVSIPRSEFWSFGPIRFV